MNVKNPNSLNYELGVLMFNLVSNHGDSLVITNNYDATENFVGIIEAIGYEDLSDLKEGFIAECKNYNIEQKEALRLFNEALEIVSNH